MTVSTSLSTFVAIVTSTLKIWAMCGAAAAA
jgi:hypothetical protein